MLLGERKLGGNDTDLDTRLMRWRSDSGQRAKSARRVAQSWASSARAPVSGTAGPTLALASPTAFPNAAPPTGPTGSASAAGGSGSTRHHHFRVPNGWPSPRHPAGHRRPDPVGRNHRTRRCGNAVRRQDRIVRTAGSTRQPEPSMRAAKPVSAQSGSRRGRTAKSILLRYPQLCSKVSASTAFRSCRGTTQQSRFGQGPLSRTVRFVRRQSDDVAR